MTLTVSYSLDTEVEYWQESDGEIEQDLSSQSPNDLVSPQKETETDHSILVWWIVTFVSLFQTLHCISDRAIAWLLKFLPPYLNTLGSIHLYYRELLKFSLILCTYEISS